MSVTCARRLLWHRRLGRRPTCGLTYIANTVNHTIGWNRKTRTKKSKKGKRPKAT